ncbi:MAG: DUF1700 domain-containing protein [Clostridia bacterium]|nr:DUF1700 domain-containing protein [Clostridia bacterium]
MNKSEFLAQLKKGLSGLPEADVAERLSFYGEMIDDRIEDGLSEEEAVNEIGNVDEIVSQIISEVSLPKLVKQKISPKRKLTAVEIVLLILGLPIWLPLLIAAIAVAFSVYVTVWAVIVSLWAAFVSLIAGGLSAFVSGVALLLNQTPMSGLLMLAALFICAGLSVFAFFGCMAATKGILALTKRTAVWLKTRMMKGEE